MGLMDNLKEAVKDRVNAALTKKKYFPTSKDELKKLVDNELVKLGEIDVSAISDMSELFRDSKRKDFSGIELWDVSNVTDMSAMFENAHLFNQRGIENWNVSKVENMSNMFRGCYFFDQPLGRWNVSSVTDMNCMFFECKSFDSDISAWNVSNVENMSEMFYSAFTFNKPLNTWNVSKVANMSSMFDGAYLFNQPLNSWDTSSVENMNSMFCDARNFNSEIDGWDLSSLNSASNMFGGCYFFNQPLNNWKLGNVTDMRGMFEDCYFFNQPLDSWNVSSVEDFRYMFEDCYNFNQDISGWDMSSATDISNMLKNCVLFDQDLSAWNSDNITDSNGAFEGCYSLKEPKWLKEVEARIKANEDSDDDYDDESYDDESDESYDEDDDSGENTGGIDMQDGKIVLNVKGGELSFNKLGEQKIGFEIPQKALKFLCYALCCDSAGDDVYGKWDNEKELYASGELKALTLKVLGDEGRCVYKFSEDRKLEEFACDMDHEAKIADIEYFKKDSENWVKGVMSGVGFESLECFNNTAFSKCSFNNIFASMYENEVDISELRDGEFSINVDCIDGDIAPILRYNQFGVLESIDEENYPGSVAAELDDDGAYIRAFLTLDDDGELRFAGDISVVDDDEYVEVTMPQEFFCSCDGVLDGFYKDDDTYDLAWDGDDEEVQIKEVFMKMQDWYETHSSHDGFDIDEIENDGGEWRFGDYRVENCIEGSWAQEQLEEENFDELSAYALIKYATVRLKKRNLALAVWGGFKWCGYEDMVAPIVMF